MFPSRSQLGHLRENGDSIWLEAAVCDGDNPPRGWLQPGPWSVVGTRGPYCALGRAPQMQRG